MEEQQQKLLNVVKVEESSLDIFEIEIKEETIKSEEQLVEEQELPLKYSLSEKSFHCTQCSVKYSNPEYLSIHSIQHNPNMVCSLCSQQFPNKSEFKRHVNEHIKTKTKEDRKISLTCSYCSKIFRKKSGFIDHTRVHTNERPYKCEICGEGFKQNSSLKVHYIIHTKERRYVCEICNGAFSTSSTLNRHKKIHEKGKTLNCKRCNLQFFNRADFNTHYVNTHPRAEFPRTCHTCSQTFNTRISFRNHKRLYCDHFPKYRCFSCMLCGADIRKNSGQHARQHLGYTVTEEMGAIKSKSFPCKRCSAVYTLKLSLLKHMEKHMEKTVRCELCNVDATYYGLKLHNMRLHRKMECKLCRETFIGKNKLDYHYQKLHKKRIKEYPCTLCRKIFRKKTFLQNHRRIHHKNIIKNFTCSICNLRFATHLLMVAHKNRKHEVKIKCSTCDHSFKTSKDIISHSLQHRRSKRIKNMDSALKEITVKTNKSQKHLQCTKCNKIFKSLRFYKSHISQSNCTKLL